MTIIAVIVTYYYISGTPCDKYRGYCDVLLHIRQALWQLPLLLWRISTLQAHPVTITAVFVTYCFNSDTTCDNYRCNCDVLLHFRHSLWQLPRLLWRISQMSWCRQWRAPRKIEEPDFWRRDTFVYQRLDYCEYMFSHWNLRIFLFVFLQNVYQYMININKYSFIFLT